MSEYDDPNGEQGPTNDLQALRQAAQRGEKAAKERDEAMRKLALVEAGVDTKSPVGKLFSDAYKGPLEEEAIRAAWQEVAPAGAPSQPVPPETPEATPPVTTPEQHDETEQRRLLTSAGAGDTPHETPAPDPVAAGYEEFHDRMAKGDTRIKAAGSVFGALIQGAAAGDERAIWNGWTEEQLAAAKDH